MTITVTPIRGLGFGRDRDPQPATSQFSNCMIELRPRNGTCDGNLWRMTGLGLFFMSTRFHSSRYLPLKVILWRSQSLHQLQSVRIRVLWNYARTSTAPPVKELKMPIKYRSTRGKQHGLRFEEVILGGLATDRGLYVPETIPTFTIEEIEKVVMLHHRLGDEMCNEWKRNAASNHSHFIQF